MGLEPESQYSTKGILQDLARNGRYERSHRAHGPVCDSTRNHGVARAHHLGGLKEPA